MKCTALLFVGWPISCYCVSEGSNQSDSESCAADVSLTIHSEAYLEGVGFQADTLGKLRPQVQCVAICDKGVSSEDVVMAQRLAGQEVASGQNLSELSAWCCSRRCQQEASAPVDEVPGVFVEYFEAAARCAGAGTTPLDSALARLRDCGVVHLDAGTVFDATLVATLRAAYVEMQQQEAEAWRLDKGHLRAGFNEWWPPARPPFTSADVIRAPALNPILAAYLGVDYVLDSMSVVTNGNVDQDLHADFHRGRHHVEVHLSLVDTNLEMGCTRFCPGTAALPTLASHITPQEWCSDPALMYSRPAKAGEVTIYDSHVVHAGSANRGVHPRPVLMLSYAVDGNAVDARDYHKGWFAEDTQAMDRAVDDVTEYRASFLRLGVFDG